ncbi:MAG: pyridoxamine 5'-phosphate oxidase family protein [Anaerolineales bacterium]|nr:pyridoxamine 5'-phosphate oxidase family protein [Anaerolineales bacterium]
MEKTLPQFSDADARDLRAEMKIGLLVTVDPRGLPHVTMLSTLMACGPQTMCFGQFTEGLSKGYLRQNPKAGFLIMSLDRHEWRGRAVFTHTAREGAEYEYYNNVPMFRYNAYFGVHTVYYLDLVGHTGKAPLAMKRIIPAAVRTMLGRTLGRKPGRQAVLNPWTRAFLNKLDNLKFLAYVGADGFPVIFPAIQAQSLDSEHVLFATGAYTEELERIPPGIALALFGLSLTMEDVLLRGRYQGLRRMGGVRAGLMQVEWVYNAMPPVPGQIYPPLPLEAVEHF